MSRIIIGTAKEYSAWRNVLINEKADEVKDRDCTFLRKSCFNEKSMSLPPHPFWCEMGPKSLNFLGAEQQQGYGKLFTILLPPLQYLQLLPWSFRRYNWGPETLLQVQRSTASMWQDGFWTGGIEVVKKNTFQTGHLHSGWSQRQVSSCIVAPARIKSMLLKTKQGYYLPIVWNCKWVSTDRTGNFRWVWECDSHMYYSKVVSHLDFFVPFCTF